MMVKQNKTKIPAFIFLVYKNKDENSNCLMENEKKCMYLAWCLIYSESKYMKANVITLLRLEENW